MLGFAKIELVIKFDAASMNGAEFQIEEMFETIKSELSANHGADVVETMMDATSFEEGTEDYPDGDHPY